MNRSQAREVAFYLVFEHLFHQEADMEQIIATYDELASEDTSAGLERTNGFARSLAAGTSAHQAELDGVIERLAVDWKLHRLPRVTLGILRLAVYEMAYEEAVPVSVTINEAVELAKRFSTQEDASYINGILGSYAKELEA